MKVPYQDFALSQGEFASPVKPPVCVVSGLPATELKAMRVRWLPSWVPITLLLGVLPYLIASRLAGVHVAGTLPLAAGRRNGGRRVWGMVALGGLAVAVVSILVAATVGGTSGSAANGISAVAFLLGLLAFLVAAVVWLLMAGPRLRADRNPATGEITVVVLKAHPAFIAAMEQGRMQWLASMGYQPVGPASPPTAVNGPPQGDAASPPGAGYTSLGQGHVEPSAAPERAPAPDEGAGPVEGSPAIR